MISDLTAMIFVGCLVTIAIFIMKSMRERHMPLIHKLYLAIAVSFGVWLVALLGMKFTDLQNSFMMYIWDSLTYTGAAFAPALSLCIALVFTQGWERMKPWSWALFVIPVLTNIIVWTNPVHHLQYEVFSLVRSEIIFGPYIYVSGLYTYFCLITGMVLMINFTLKNESRLYLKQCILVTLGALFPLVVSSLATFGAVDMPITATPLSFIPTVLLNGIAIYQLHILNIKPIATQHILDWISDCYLVLSDTGLVITYNQPFEKIFSKNFGISENRYLSDCVKEEDVVKKSAIYNLMMAIESCRESKSAISYEESVVVPDSSGFRKNYYIVDVTPLLVTEKLSGFIIIYKDITPLKKSMQQLQDSQSQMMEQERMAFLGQMISGLAHNLKTPIMSISGCISATEDLVDECESSLDDNDVTIEDYHEIYREIREWFTRMRESASYMSDIITAIKGQAATVSASEDTSFTLDDLIRRIMLLMRHELQSSRCILKLDYNKEKNFVIQGDISNLLQVMNNLLSNAIYAQKQVGGGEIVITIKQDHEHLKILIKDTGPGVKPQIRQRLFKEMITSKGTMGTGLGLYISNMVIRGKFGGSMWLEDNPGGGSIFGISIPMEAVSISSIKEREVQEH